MKHVEQAIKEALEKGGYAPYKSRHTKPEYFIQAIARESEKAFLDPLFWQALGKARGWGSFYDDEGMPRIYDTQGWYPNTGATPSGEDNMAWQAYWHRLVDFLAEGKTAEEFFEGLAESSPNLTK